MPCDLLCSQLKFRLGRSRLVQDMGIPIHIKETIPFAHDGTAWAGLSSSSVSASES
jgi:hypothetical protein